MQTTPTGYTIRESVAELDDFLRLRRITGLTPRSRQAAERGLPNSLYGVTVMRGLETVGMGRVVGDGGLNFEIVDIAVAPEHQGNGLGTWIMHHIMAYIRAVAPETAYVTLMADAPALYQKFGFAFTRPRSHGMYLLVGETPTQRTPEGTDKDPGR